MRQDTLARHRHLRRFSAPLVLSIAAAALLAPASASAQLLGPTPYLQASDSPFATLSGYTYSYLENFEDHLLNVPGVSASAGGVSSVVFGPNIHDSVDGDDGVIDGSGLNGDSYFTPAGQNGISFTFDASVLGGHLPTHAGIVWTDGTNNIFFEAFDQNGNSLGSLTGTHANNSFNGETDEDRFYGAVNAGGISRIFISNGPGGLEVDHLQYNDAPIAQTTTPEPSSVALLATGLLGIVPAIRRRKR